MSFALQVVCFMVLMKLLSTARYKVQQVHGYHADQLQSSDPILSRAPQRLRGKCRCKSEDEESEDRLHRFRCSTERNRKRTQYRPFELRYFRADLLRFEAIQLISIQSEAYHARTLLHLKLYSDLQREPNSASG